MVINYVNGCDVTGCGVTRSLNRGSSSVPALAWEDFIKEHERIRGVTIISTAKFAYLYHYNICLAYIYSL